MTKELCERNLLVLIIKLYLKKRVSKEYTRKPIYWVGEDGAKILFYFPIYLIQNMTILAQKLSCISIEIETNSETI